ncbi:cytochrome b-245 chaperone 1 homolog [Conger conger]|nr:cytochrome b-245 chaperone 1 homolog [Conger conger]
MGYMVVAEHTSSLLHLKRLPGIRSWSLLVGISSVGLAAAYYSTDSVLWKLFYVTGCFFVAMQNMDDWEEAIFDKSRSVIELKTFSLYAKILTLWKRGQEKMMLDMQNVRDVCVEEEKVRYLGKGYLVTLRMATGFSHPLTQSATLGGRSDADSTVALLKRFLGFEELQRRWQQEEECDDSSDSEDLDEL